MDIRLLPCLDYCEYGNTKDLKYPKQSWDRKTQLEESGSLTLHFLWYCGPHASGAILASSELCGGHLDSHTVPDWAPVPNIGIWIVMQ